MFKWKQEHTIDLFVKRENKNVIFYNQKKTETLVYKTLKSESEKRLIKEFLTTEQLKTGVIVEFKFENHQFIPYRIRTDKNKANSEITIKNTLINIEEAIDITKLKNNV